MKTYRPLPDYLTIKSSPIEGLGLFSTKPIPTGTDLGTSHFSFFGQDLVRTALGAFVNHSEEPNIIKVQGTHMGYGYSKLLTIQDIPPNTELTLCYKLYSPK